MFKLIDDKMSNGYVVVNMAHMGNTEKGRKALEYARDTLNAPGCLIRVDFEVH